MNCICFVKLFRKLFEYKKLQTEFIVYLFLNIMEFIQTYTCLSLGNLVEGLPGALYREELWGGQGSFGPALIHTLDPKEL